MSVVMDVEGHNPIVEGMPLTLLYCPGGSVYPPLPEGHQIRDVFPFFNICFRVHAATEMEELAHKMAERFPGMLCACVVGSGRSSCDCLVAQCGDNRAEHEYRCWNRLEKEKGKLQRDSLQGRGEILLIN
eukprot:1160137-Pelagomonas_calceolata.AAC.17